MTENRKISRILQFIIRMRSPLGCDKYETAELFEVHVRTIERYMALLQEIGFQIEKHGNRFSIVNTGKSKLNPEELIAFSIEEAHILRDALLNTRLTGPIQRQLLDKLYALTDLEELAYTMSDLQQSLTISHLRQAIRDKLQVVLCDYDSANSDSRSDRIVEPIRFQDYFRYLTAFEPSSGINKVFKTERIGEVVMTSNKWKHESKHQKLGMDAFGLTGATTIPVMLKLSRRARQLLCEEHADAAPFVSKKGNTYIFEGDIYGLEGVGRFVMGLLDEIEVVDPQELKEYIQKIVTNYNQRR